jgi:hypothetical protein
MIPSKKKAALLGFALVVLVVAALVIVFRLVDRSADAGPDPALAPLPEGSDDWISLFDGTTLTGWRGLGLFDPPDGHWTVRRPIEDPDGRRPSSGRRRPVGPAATAQRNVRGFLAASVKIARQASI